MTLLRLARSSYKFAILIKTLSIAMSIHALYNRYENYIGIIFFVYTLVYLFVLAARQLVKKCLCELLSQIKNIKQTQTYKNNQIRHLIANQTG